MKKIKLLTFLLIIYSNSFGQINIDSIFKTFHSERPIDSIIKNDFYTIKHINKNENTLYEFSFDINNYLSNNIWGICLYKTKLDSIGRPIEIKSYNKDGHLFGSDSEPVVKIRYADNNRFKQTEYYNENLILKSRVEIYSDTLNREVLSIYYDKDFKIKSKQTTEYLDKENALIKKYYDSNDNLETNKCGVSIWYIRYNKTNEFEIERRYLDKDSKLVDCNHEDSEIKYAYNIATQIGYTNEWKMVYYTKKGRIVKEFKFKSEN